MSASCLTPKGNWAMSVPLERVSEPRGEATHSPSAGGKMDGAVSSDEQSGANALPQSRAMVLPECHRVAGGRALTAEEGQPVIVAIAEDRITCHCRAGEPNDLNR